MKATLIFDEIFLKHDLPTHPENALRLKYFLSSADKFPIKLVKPPPVSLDLLTKVHSENYIEEVKLSSFENAPGFFDSDTYYNQYTYQASIKAAGAVEKGVELAKKGEKRVFCAVRPPGHHAEKNRAMGFCIFNNVVVGAFKALELGFKKVFIVDFDAHHGNGTQNLVKDNPRIFYFSTHQYPFYPGTGSTKENKENVFNVPLPAESGDETFTPIYESLLPEKIKEFSPELILVSAGYDLHEEDPLTELKVTDKGVETIVSTIVEIASEIKVPVVFTLEGGYNLKALQRCGEITFSVLTS